MHRFLEVPKGDGQGVPVEKIRNLSLNLVGGWEGPGQGGPGVTGPLDVGFPCVLTQDSLQQR